MDNETKQPADSNPLEHVVMCDEYGDALEPYADGDYWALPYLDNGAGGTGGGMGVIRDKSKEKVKQLYVERMNT